MGNSKFNVWDASRLFFLTFKDSIKTWFELSRVKLYNINDLRGNKNHFELAGGSSYRGFELPRVNYSNINV